MKNMLRINRLKIYVCTIHVFIFPWIISLILHVFLLSLLDFTFFCFFLLLTWIEISYCIFLIFIIFLHQFCKLRKIRLSFYDEIKSNKLKCILAQQILNINTLFGNVSRQVSTKEKEVRELFTMTFVNGNV